MWCAPPSNLDEYNQFTTRIDIGVSGRLWHIDPDEPIAGKPGEALRVIRIHVRLQIKVTLKKKEQHVNKFS